MTDIQQNHRYGGRKVFVLETASLRSGDIMLTRNSEGSGVKGPLQSDLIIRVSKGTYDHALICSQPPTFIEAVGTGVRTISAARAFVHDPANIRILRYPNAEVAAQAAIFAQLQVGREYSTRQAMASVFPERLVDAIADRGIFCSALVALVFQEAGAAEFKTLLVAKTTPATLEKLPFLSDITDDLLREVLSPPNIEAMAALDGDKPPSISERQTEIGMRYARSVVPLAEALLQQYPEIKVELLQTYFGLVTFVMDAADAAPKVPEARRGAYLEALAAVDMRLAELAGSGEFDAMMNEILDMDSASLARDLQESFQTNPDIDVQAMRNQLATSQGMLAKRKQAIAQFEAWGLDRSEALALHVRREGRAIAFYERQISALCEILGRLVPGG